jgi:hypothetical protein
VAPSEPPATGPVRRVLPLDFEPSRKPPADLDVRILGQLPAAEFTLGDALEPRPLEIVGFDAPLGGGSLRKQADLDVRILGQLPAAEFTLGDALEPRPLEIVGFDAPLGGGSLRKQQLNHAPRPRTTPRHSPISTPTSTACRSAFHSGVLGE